MEKLGRRYNKNLIFKTLDEKLCCNSNSVSLIADKAKARKNSGFDDDSYANSLNGLYKNSASDYRNKGKINNVLNTWKSLHDIELTNTPSQKFTENIFSKIEKQKKINFSNQKINTGEEKPSLLKVTQESSFLNNLSKQDTVYWKAWEVNKEKVEK
jgi:hypothetical protein